MMKFITRIAAFTLTFVFSVALIGFPKAEIVPFEIRGDSQTQQNVASLLRRDIGNGEQRDVKIDKIDSESSKSVYFEEYKKFINEYVSKSSSLNDADLPPDFQIAWRAHMQAWQDYADFLNSLETVKIPGWLFSRLEDEYDQEISRTWYEVLRVGKDYGANPAIR